jgi:quercetin dioxygenase-like cupin family protein
MQVIAQNDREIELWRDGVETRMLVSSLNGAAQLCIFEQWVEPGHGAPTHVHPVEEVLTVLAGEAEIWVKGERAVVTRQQTIVIPADNEHGFKNVGSGRLHVHAILASPAFVATYASCGETISRWVSQKTP